MKIFSFFLLSALVVESRSRLEKLPREILFQIFESLSYQDLHRLCQVSETIATDVGLDLDRLFFRNPSFNPLLNEEDKEIILKFPLYYEKFLLAQNNSQERFILASELGLTRIVKDAIKNDMNPRLNQDLVFRNAIAKDQVEILKILLSWKGSDGEFIDPTAINVRDGKKAIELAGIHGHFEVAQELLAWKGPNGEWVDPRVENERPMWAASCNGHNETLKVFLTWKGPNGEWVDPRSRSNQIMEPIEIASSHGHAGVAKVLLQWKGPNGEFVNPKANDALKFATSLNRFEVLQELLAWKGPNGEIVDPRVLDSAVIGNATREGYNQAVQVLLNWRGPNGEFIPKP